MKILLIAHHCCSRAQKQANALMSNGHDVYLISHRCPENWWKYKAFIRFYTADQLREGVRLLEDVIDIIHVHNEPNWLAILAKEVTKKPVILDIHDSMAYRTDDPEKQSNEERLAFDMVDGFVLVSEPCREITKPDKPYAILAPYVNREDLKLDTWTYLGGIVYEGRLDLPDAHNGVMKYCDYTEFSEKMRDVGIPFNVYCPKPEVLKYYGEHGAVVQKPLPYDVLLKALGMYDWGFCGNIQEHKDWQVAMPNKLFEYMAAGIPIIAMNAKLVGDFVEEHGVGISVKTIDEIKERWDERAECQKNVIMKRHEFVMENHIGKVEDLYKRILQG